VPTGLVVFVVKLDQQFGPQKLASRNNAYTRCVLHQIWVQQKGCFAVSHPTIWRQILASEVSVDRQLVDSASTDRLDEIYGCGSASLDNPADGIVGDV